MSIYAALTVREVADWWGIPISTAHRKLLQWHEENPGSTLSRRSGRTLLLDIRVPLAVFGSTDRKRPSYE